MAYDTFTLNIPISKVDEDQRIVTGIATSEALDSQGDIVDYEASKRAFADWTGNIREMHNPIAIGKGIDVQYDDKKKAVIVSAKISESADGQNAWTKVKEGILTGFSIGGKIFEIAKDKTVEGATRVVDYALSELSLVDSPANPEAQLLMVKSANGVLQRVEVGMKKGGINVVDGDPRDHTGATVTEVTASTPVIPTTGKVTKVIYGKTPGSTTTKSVYDAQEAMSVAAQLSWLIINETNEGDEDQVKDLVTAFNALRDFAAKEVQEGDDFDWQAGFAEVVELANKAINLRKEKAMAGKKVEKTNVVDGVERDEEATVVADERPTNVVKTAEEPVEAEVVDSEIPVVSADEPSNETATEVEVTADEKEEETDTTEAEVVEETEDKGSEKSDTASTLVKSVETLLSKLDQGQGVELKKVADLVKDLDAKVEKSMASLEERVKKIEETPVPTKSKASFMVEKGSEVINTDTAALLKRQEELIADPSQAEPGEMMELALKIRKANTAQPITIQ